MRVINNTKTKELEIVDINLKDTENFTKLITNPLVKAILLKDNPDFIRDFELCKTILKLYNNA